jgi:hypothetical protein
MFQPTCGLSSDGADTLSAALNRQQNKTFSSKLMPLNGRKSRKNVKLKPLQYTNIQHWNIPVQEETKARIVEQ